MSMNHNPRWTKHMRVKAHLLEYVLPTSSRMFNWHFQDNGHAMPVSKPKRIFRNGVNHFEASPWLQN